MGCTGLRVSTRKPARCLLVAKEVLDQPILQGVEGDHHHPPARREDGQRLRQHLGDGVELVVGGDPQGLEDTRGVARGAPANLGG